MKIPVADIFRDIQREGTSFSIARRICHEGHAKFNGLSVTLMSEVEVHEGDVFDVNGQAWEFENNAWIKQK
jgi:hypothetical protein